MKINIATSIVDDADQLESTKARIELNAVITHVLSRDLYQRPVEAVLREVLVNALDAHAEAGVERPVEVELPGPWNEVFSIRDYGRGMSHEQVMDIYLTFGASTRRGDNVAHGGLGLGTKSPLTYTDAFTVISHHDGERREYLVYYDADGIPCITLREVRATDETGLQVTFTLRQAGDYTQFRTAAESVLAYVPQNLYTLSGGMTVKPLMPEYNRYGPIGIRKGFGVEIIMGYVRYDVDIKQLMQMLSATKTTVSIGDTDHALNAMLDRLTTYNRLALFANIGDYQIHPSRESVIVTRRDTNAFAEALANGFAKMFANSDAVNVQKNLLMMTLVGTVPDSIDKLKVRARVCHPKTYSWHDSAGLSNQLVSYGDLLRHLESNNKTYPSNKLVLLSSTDMTDYVGGSRREYKFPHGFATGVNVIFLDYETSDDEVVAAFSALDIDLDVSTDIEKYRREQQVKGVGVYRATRQSVRAMQEPTHNVQVLDYALCTMEDLRQGTQEYAQYSHGRYKKHWASAEHNVRTLQALKRPIFWLPTNMGCCVAEQRSVLNDYVDAIKAVKTLIPEDKLPIIIGLPASKGTKKIETVFRPLDRFESWFANTCALPSVKKRLEFAKARLLLSSLNEENLRELTAYGPAARLYQIYQRGFRCTTSFESAHRYFIHTSMLQHVEKYILINADGVTELFDHVRTVFPAVEWNYYSYTGKIQANLPSMVEWSKTLAKISNKHPTGAKYKLADRP